MKPGALLLLLLAGCATAPVPVAIIHESDTPAGTTAGDTISVTLELKRAMWYPETDADPGAEVWAIVADGGQPLIPGPLLRGNVNTTFRVTVRNPSHDSVLVVHGLGTRPGTIEPVAIAAQSDTTVTFAAGAPGSYYYHFGWGEAEQPAVPADEALLAGALIVDSAGPVPTDRIFVVSSWFIPPDSALGDPVVPRDWMVINGRSFPHNPTIEMQQGDTVRWRWINASHDAHPIHLHGDHFRITRTGDISSDRDHWGQEVVTQLMLPGETFAAEYVPAEPGNWLLHCHFSFHTSHFLSTERIPEVDDPGGAGAVDHSMHGMKGMLITIKVTPRDGGLRRPAADSAARRVRILAQDRPAVEGRPEWLGFVQVDSTEPHPDSVPDLSHTLVLQRGEPVAITVVNRLRAPTALHWHGMELPSWSDGVPGWSGGLPDVAGVIAPGDSFVARFTPPRAGTFIYHSHSNELHQIGAGLYGALLVVDPAVYRPELERLVVAGGDGRFSETIRVNGSRTPAPITIPAGVPIRFRLVSIHIDHRLSMQLQSEDQAMPWRMIAKDGAEIPVARQVVDTMPWISGPGETADFEVLINQRGSYTLMVKRQLGGPEVSVRLDVE